ncbi:hypothetical protein [Agromyces archimandritae]|uniref:Uncharacterized protein n=1 Tax=Agromyces archimandritae TaxID=2781962 RepID=A0A975IRB1_9MICO|nr:hypothetical protein [Agromyces archimandritae]QTX05901.1 hypothetical protein G127AT_06825 [Agromyces archimandritae]
MARDEADDYGPLSEIAEARVPEEPARRPMRIWDLIVSIVLLLIMVALAALITFAAPYIAFARTGCADSAECLFGTDGITTTMLIAPGIISLVGSIAAVALLAFRRIAFWVPLVGIVLLAVLFLLAMVVL